MYKDNSWAPKRENLSSGILTRSLKTSLLSFKDLLENQNLPCSKLRYDTFQMENNKGADCADAQAGLRFCCLQTLKKGFLASRQYAYKW